MYKVKGGTLLDLFDFGGFWNLWKSSKTRKMNTFLRFRSQMRTFCKNHGFHGITTDMKIFESKLFKVKGCTLWDLFDFEGFWKPSTTRKMTWALCSQTSRNKFSFFWGGLGTKRLCGWKESKEISILLLNFFASTWALCTHPPKINDWIFGFKSSNPWKRSKNKNW